MKKFTKINESKTNPWFKKGEVLVKFVDGKKITDEVVSFLLKRLGMDYKKDGHKPAQVKITPSMDMDYYIVQVPVGKENETMKILEKEFGDEIDWVERRDVKQELRSYFSEYVSETMTNMSEEYHTSDDVWKNTIDNVITLLNLLKDDNYDEIKKQFTDDIVQDKFKNLD